MTLLFLLALAPSAHAQDLELPVLSPAATVSQKVGTVTVSVDYSSPGKRDRDIFGALVPYGEVWRSGANRATQLTVDGEVMVEGKALPAGTYSVFTKPGESAWMWMINGDPTASAGRYDAGKDAVAVEVKPMEGAARERLTYLFEDTTDASTTLVLEWAGTKVPLSITVDSKARGDASIEGFMSGAVRNFVGAARFKSENGDHEAAEELAQHAVAVDRNWYSVWALADVLHAAGENKAAYKAAKEAMALGEEAENFFYEGRVKKALAEWPKK